MKYLITLITILVILISFSAVSERNSFESFMKDDSKQLYCNIKGEGNKLIKKEKIVSVSDVGWKFTDGSSKSCKIESSKKH